MRARFLAAALALAALVAASAPAAAGAALELRAIDTFRAPVHVAQAPGQPRLLFVVEQPGRVMLARDGERVARPFLDIRRGVAFGEESGLLSIAFDPDYRRSRRFYVFYVANSGANKVVSFRSDPDDPTRAVRRSRRLVLRILHPYGNLHNGGQLAFGPDGYLWISSGDGTCCGDPFDQARSLGTMLGKLLRIDPLPGGGYAVPAGNPLVGEPGLDEIYAWGLRNAWRFSFDKPAGAIVIGDVGQSAVEEVDYATIAAAAGANFGWPEYEGFASFDPTRPGPGEPVAPLHDYPHGPACAVTAGPVVHDGSLPSMGGRLLYADLCTGEIRSLAPSGPAAPDDQPTGLHVSQPSSFGEGLGGQTYVAPLDGIVSRIVEG